MTLHPIDGVSQKKTHWFHKSLRNKIPTIHPLARYVCPAEIVSSSRPKYFR
jgi:hypothetical protein